MTKTESIAQDNGVTIYRAVGIAPLTVTTEHETRFCTSCFQNARHEVMTASSGNVVAICSCGFVH